MNVIRWNPFRELDEFWGRYGEPTREVAARDWVPPVDIRETENAYRVDVELPAIAPEDVNVTLKDGLLTVSGERSVETEHDDERVHRSERRFGRFVRSFRLPEDADDAGIDASSKNGVVSIVVAKREVAKPRAIEVKVH